MTVGELKLKLESFKNETEVTIDQDSYGWWDLEEITMEEDGEVEYCNLVTSSEL